LAIAATTEGGVAMSNRWSRSLLPILGIASAFGLVTAGLVTAAPVGASALLAPAGTTASMPVAPSTATVVNSNCNTKGTCIYVTRSGFFVQTVKGTGRTPVKGCTKAQLLINDRVVTQTPSKCWPRGTAIQATFTINKTFHVGDRFLVVWVGPASPPGNPYPGLKF
jgi:hypothetical protein